METVKIKITHSGEIIEYPLPELKVVALREGSIQLKEAQDTYGFKNIANYFVIEAVQSEADAHHDDIGWQPLYIVQYLDTAKFHLIINNMDWLEDDLEKIIEQCIEYNYPTIKEEQTQSPFMGRLNVVRDQISSPIDGYEQILMLHLENRFDDVEDMINILLALGRVQTTFLKEIQATR